MQAEEAARVMSKPKEVPRVSEIFLPTTPGTATRAAQPKLKGRRSHARKPRKFML
jgi:hypothetical protein